ncbi:concanavalin A-like lectin/glucanase domain-containing protein [Fomitopsis serialis]|uniref:concanavalin A-like lectin/glucanase domain-containing protein n=1 Tax=Fomitopsis serialis TaxID=139415 RepID=UPI0020075A96|nr:concanavalin A-like lectin/glucanase domain-containing protein [Neoantrodia serialis]KAH9937636.1 concanavalin A-like lectin/glucanase domain-containing protein [Neoantrodia serialis]
MSDDDELPPGGGNHDAFYVLLPLLIVLSTFLFLLLIFLLCIILLRRRRGIMLRDSDGPIDMSREDLIEGEGGFEGVESRWLETVSEADRRAYARAKDYQLQYRPNSFPTDITLSQFLSIQEKGVSAWSFEPDFEAINSMLVHARTEITFLPDPSSATCVQSNLPLPKLNEVYYWEVKMFDLPETTNVAVGLATKPYPWFRLPGLCRFSVAYHSNGDKSHNYPFTAQSCGMPLKEGDVLGVGYRPRTGTVFFTKNGRKMEDAYMGLNNWNLFPTIGADGPCSVHVNLGQSGFVFIEANVKKWGLAPSVGTLAPPPPYGSERGSLLLAAGGDIMPVQSGLVSPQSPPPGSSRSRRSHRSRRPRSALGTATPVGSSSMQASPITSPSPPETPPPPITPIEEEMDTGAEGAASTSRRYISPTDLPFHEPPNANLPPSPTRSANPESGVVGGEGEWSSGSSQTSRSPSRAGANQFNVPRPQPFSLTHPRTGSRSSITGSELAIHVHPPPESPIGPEPPTPDPQRDIRLQAFASSGLSAAGSSRSSVVPDRPPPAYSPLDAYAYSEGVHIDLPAEMIAAALERGTIPANMIGSASSRSDRHRNRRERR